MTKSQNIKRPFNYFIKGINNIKNFDYRQYTKTNILFLTFVLSNLINGCLLRFFTVRNYFELRPLIADITFLVLVGAFAYLFKSGKKQYRYFMTVSIILMLVCIVNSAYYNYYTSFTSFSLLSTLSQLAGVSDAVNKNVLSIKDLIFIWQPLYLTFVHKKLIKRDYYTRAWKIEEKQKRFSKTLSLSIIAFAMFFITCSTTELSRFYKQWNREFTVTRFGIYTYQLNDLVKTTHSAFASSFGHDKAVEKFNRYYAENEKKKQKNEFTNIFKDKNILMIHAESMQKFVMDLSFNGEEVTPTLNKLAKEGIFYSNFYAQVSTGTSSDTEFTLNTSLMPINNGTVFVSYWNRNYISLQKLLKKSDYYTFSMHANNATFWNRLAMHEKLGYDDFFAKDNYELDDMIGLGLSDVSFFKQSVQKIKKIAEENKKFSGTLITLTNHTPFYDVSEYTNLDVTMKYTHTNEDGTSNEGIATYLDNTTLGSYLKSVHYADYALGEFINELDKEGLLDNTVIVIYGDHDARLNYDDYIKMYNYDPVTDSILDENDPNYVDVDYYKYELNRKVPLIMWSKDQTIGKEITTAMGMYDVLPTMSNLFGFENSPYALGNDIMNLDDNLVSFPNGNWLTNNIYYNAQKDEFSLLNDTTIASQEDIIANSQATDDKLSISQSIIVYDLLKGK